MNVKIQFEAVKVLSGKYWLKKSWNVFISVYSSELWDNWKKNQSHFYFPSFCTIFPTRHVLCTDQTVVLYIEAVSSVSNTRYLVLCKATAVHSLSIDVIEMSPAQIRQLRGPQWYHGDLWLLGHFSVITDFYTLCSPISVGAKYLLLSWKSLLVIRYLG